MAVSVREEVSGNGEIVGHGRRDNDTGRRPGIAAGNNHETVAGALDPLNRLIEVKGYPTFGEAFFEGFHQDDERAAHVTQPLTHARGRSRPSSQVELAPQPHHRYPLGVFGEFLVEQGAPDRSPGPFPLVAANPLRCGHSFERRGVVTALQQKGRGGKSSLVQEPHGPEPEQRGGGTKVPQAAVRPDAHPGREPLDEVRQAELVGQGHVSGVGGENMVVEGLEGLASDLESPRQPPGARVALEDPDLVSGFRQTEGRGKAGEACADNSDLVSGLD